MIRAKRAKELLHMNIVGPISLINYNKIKFIVHNIDNVFRVHFKKYIKKKEKISRTLYT